MFEHYLPVSKDVIDRIWSNGLIVFDANILLHLYRYDALLRRKLLDIIGDAKIKDRIWIPNRVYEEFLKNRPAVICEQGSIEDKVQSKISNSLCELKKDIKAIFPRDFHPYISQKDLVDKIEVLEDEIKKQIHTKKKEIYNFTFDSDAILKEIQQLLERKIEPEVSNFELEEIISEGKERYLKSIPPGYKDKDKGEPDCYSDLIIWKRILNKAKEGRDIIFVIDDSKEDWWRKEKGKIIGPNPQLLKEFYNVTHSKILFYGSIKFFEYVGDFIGSSKNKLTSNDTKQIKQTTLFQVTSVKVDEYNNLKPSKEISSVKRPRRYSVDRVLDWFYNNYEDPVEGVPYSSEEGGYIYYAGGGPYEASDVICNKFPDIDKDTLESVLNEIYSNGYEWVEKGRY